MNESTWYRGNRQTFGRWESRIKSNVISRSGISKSVIKGSGKDQGSNVWLLGDQVSTGRESGIKRIGIRGSGSEFRRPAGNRVFWNLPFCQYPVAIRYFLYLIPWAVRTFRVFGEVRPHSQNGLNWHYLLHFMIIDWYICDVRSLVWRGTLSRETEYWLAARQTPVIVLLPTTAQYMYYYVLLCLLQKNCTVAVGLFQLSNFIIQILFQSVSSENW